MDPLASDSPTVFTQEQIEAAAESLYDFAWNSDPNDPRCFKQLYGDAGKPAKDHYREWAMCILEAGREGSPRHGFFSYTRGTRPWDD